jgi:pimeloyl-ACP methyl ester carboxylesterase
MHAMVTDLRVQPVRIGVHGLPGELARVREPAGTTVFVHGSGSSRLSPRNHYVAGILHRYRQNTLLFDLLTEAEAADRTAVFDIQRLGQRLAEALSWLQDLPDADLRLPLGLFGASTGAAAALRVAAQHPGWVSAVVSRGGRPDLSGVALGRVRAPTLLIVGGADTEVLALNREALRALSCRKRLDVVPGAGHLFEEPGALETVAHLAGQWLADVGCSPL